MCHIILLLPIFALPVFYFLPLGTALPLYFGVLLFTWLVYSKIIGAMKAKVKTGKEGLLGEEALVIEDINPDGKVMVLSEIWVARGNGKKFLKGQKVAIAGFDGLTAIVRDPLEQELKPRQKSL
jgi:membrane-bound ClpP family serine protease